MKNNWKNIWTKVKQFLVSKKFKISLLITIALFLILELFARFYLGLGDTPVYIESERYEYIYAPNQDVYRFGNHIVTNEHSMRSKPLSEKDKVRILKIGDSVINGGTHVDQNDLSTSLLEKWLQSETEEEIRVLNISAGSWGPDNAFAYIEEHGHFDASMIVLVWSSHDLNDNMHFKKVVGEHRMWPKDKPMLAVTDGFSNYFVPWFKRAVLGQKDTYDYLIGHNDAVLNTGWKKFFNYATQHNIELLVYVHPEKEEAAKNAYKDKGNRLIKLLESNGVNYLLGTNAEMDNSCYRDNIHPNANGHKIMADALYEPIKNHVLTQL